MFQRIENGWQLAKQSWQVLRADKELLLFPVMSGVACTLVMATFVVPLILTGAGEQIAESKDVTLTTTEQVVGALVLFAYYFVNFFVVIFFNTALVSCAMMRFRGNDPTVKDGLSSAWQRLPQIAGWAFVSATVGLILKAVESSSDRFGEIVASLAGVAWSIATFFVVPVIVVENAGPITAIKRSSQVLKKAWGESLVANVGIGVIIFLASLVCVAPIALGVYAIGAGYTVPGGIAIVLGIILLLMVMLVSSAMNAILLAALYLYAEDHTVPADFDEQLFQRAFHRKSRTTFR